MSSFPTTVKTFTTKVAADTIQPAHINDLQDEVAAIESGLINGTTTSLNVGFSTINLAGGQLTFPAVQAASSGANTLDDYEEGTWTPTLTFFTPGDLSVAYSTRTGSYTKIGRMVTVTFNVVTSTFTHSTASGSLFLSGLPFTVGSYYSMGGLWFTGITKAGYTNFSPRTETADTKIAIVGSGSGVSASLVDKNDTPSGTQQTLVGTITYFV